jgi:hypothetical protein
MLRPALSGLRVCVATLLFGLFASPSLHAQILPPDGSDQLEKQFDRTQRETAQKLARGDAPYGDEHKETVKVMAKWYSYRLTWPKYQNEAGMMKRLFDEYEQEIGTAGSKKPATQPFLDAFTKNMVVTTREVLKGDPGARQPAIARINAVRQLAFLAKFGQEEAADVFVEVIKDPDPDMDASRYYAFQGLRDLFAQAQKTPMKDKAREARSILALIEFLDKPMTVPPSMSREEVEGLRFLRREATRALALTRYPAVAEEKTKAIQGRTALVLLRIARKNGLVPEPRWDEQVEAAIGLARLQCKLFEDYQPDYAAQQIGGALVDFANVYNQDDSKEKEKGYKIYAMRFTEALAAMKTDVTKNIKDKEIVQYVNDMINRAVKVLSAIENKASTANAAADLDNWVNNTAPKSASVYKGAADAKLRTEAPPPAAAPPK